MDIWKQCRRYTWTRTLFISIFELRNCRRVHPGTLQPFLTHPDGRRERRDRRCPRRLSLTPPCSQCALLCLDRDFLPDRQRAGLDDAGSLVRDAAVERPYGHTRQAGRGVLGACRRFCSWIDFGGCVATERRPVIAAAAQPSLRHGSAGCFYRPQTISKRLCAAGGSPTDAIAQPVGMTPRVARSSHAIMRPSSKEIG